MNRLIVALTVVVALLVLYVMPAEAAFTATGSMAAERLNHAATLLPNGKVLITGGQNGSGAWSSAELYDPATGTLTTTGSMNAARAAHTATLLPNGKVLITGGTDTWFALSSTELYDPATGTFTSIGSMTAARDRHTATLLPNGKVLITGGYNGSSGSSSVELYDPTTGTFTVTGSMTAARCYPTATLLPNGKVLITGGYDNGGFNLSSAELYDPATGTFTATGSMTAGREEHAATLLPNGKVLITGGTDDGSLYFSSAELYDPATGTFTAIGSMTAARGEHIATLLPNGKVLITGGWNNGIELSSAELYDIGIDATRADKFTATGSMAVARDDAAITLLPNGKVLIAGGNNVSGNLSSAELYDPATGTFATTGNMSAARYYHSATLLPNGKVLIAGGVGVGPFLSSAELYDPTTGTFTATGSMAAARENHTAILLPNGKVLIVGGYNAGSGYLSSAALYDPETGTFTATGSMATVRLLPSMTLLPNGKVLIAGGNNSSGSLSSTELYDPATEAFTATGSMAAARIAAAVTLLPNGKVLIAGGSGSLSSAELYDPGAGTFTATDNMAAARYHVAATLLPSGKVLVAGGSYLSTAELYDIGYLDSSSNNWTLSTAVTGSGSISSNPAGISCGSTCSASFSNDTVVALTATPDPSYAFTGWSGACTGIVACNVTMNQARSVIATFALPTCNAPFQITAPANAASGSYLVSWYASATTGAAYVLEEKVNSGPWTEVYTGTAKSYNASNMTNGTYQYRVKATMGGYTDSVWTTSGTVTVALTCSAPYMITAPANANSGNYAVSWYASATIGAAYVLEESANSGPWTPVYTGPATSYAFSGKANGTYQYRVKAILGGYTDSTWSTSGIVTVAVTCSAPYQITAPASSISGKYSISWYASATTGAAYALEEKVGSGVWVQVYAGTAKSYAFTGKANDTYLYRVKATLAGNADSNWTTSVVVTVNLTCSATYRVTAPATSTSGSYIITWYPSATTGATYVLEEKVNGGLWVSAGSGTAASRIFSGKTSGTYQYRVKVTKSSYVDSNWTTSGIVTVP